MTLKIIDGKKIRDEVKNNLIDEIKNLDEKLKLVVIQVGDNPASDIYVRNKKKLCEETGIIFEHKKYDSIDEETLIKEIEKLNNDEQVTGILVQLPLPKEINETRVIEKIDYKKDVDGLTSKNIGNLYSKQRGIIPCTAYGIMKIFDYENIPLEGKNVVLIGRSKLVGIPLISLLLNKNATVTICHTKTKNIKEITKKADILIVAAGKKGLVTKDMINNNTIIIDVGINREDGKIYGDVDKNVIESCNAITPVPGGVGPLTVIMLVNNVLECYKIQKDK